MWTSPDACTDVFAWRPVGALFPVPWQRCSYWPVRAPERFQGPFNGTFKNKVLLIGNAVCFAFSFMRPDR